MHIASANFAFLAPHDSLLVRLGTLAELYTFSDPNTALFKIRQFGEALLQRVAARAAVRVPDEGSQSSLIGALYGQGVLPPEVKDHFHILRQSGNAAVHGFGGSEGEVVHHLKVARELGVWFHRTFSDPAFKPGAFVSPRPVADPAAELREQLEQLRRESELQRARLDEAGLRAALEEELRLEAERRAGLLAEDRDAAFSLAGEMEQLLSDERARMQAELAAVRAQAASAGRVESNALRDRARAAADLMELDERGTRERIDRQLREAGWEADSATLRYALGTRPESGRNLAIAEWPTATGPADYVLFRGLHAIATVEAKRGAINVAGALEQARRYSEGYIPSGEDIVSSGPWGLHRIPFLFSTNGRPYLLQVQERSGVWFLDARRPTNHPRALQGWYSPEGLSDLLALDVEAAERSLVATATDPLPLRDYQRDAVAAVERTILEGRRTALVAMATGTGKTRTAVALIYRLLQAGRFRRVLFLVDRTALGDQALGTFSSVRMGGSYTFREAYEIAPVDTPSDDDTVLDIATVQGMVKRVLYAAPGEAPPVDSYDLILVDECHRGYSLDREMNDAELSFRSEEDYVSKYRRLIEYFDAVRIGLTATPAQHTTEIFGHPVYQYSYRQAVIDGFLVDHEPPTRIITALAEDGITWAAGSEVMKLDAAQSQVDVFETPDEIRMEVEAFNRRVLNENFNRVVCSELARHIDPEMPGKSLIFCANDEHADRVVRLLNEAFAARYGEVDNGAVRKLTGAADRPGELIRRYRNERLPSVAVTVDLLTTGIDIPEIVNIVFLRRVKSRILYEQMLGRGTRLRPDLYGPGEDKALFRIFDAVDLYAALQPYTEMKPVVVSPSISFSKLTAELAELRADDALRSVHDQLIAKLRRSVSRLEKTRGEEIERLTGMDTRQMANHLARLDPRQTSDFINQHPTLPALLDELRGGDRTGAVYISEHQDELRRVEHGYGKGQRPGDYLEGFREYIATYRNEIAALQIVLTRPRDLTRKQLRELAIVLDRGGYTEPILRTAWRDTTNQDIAATLIGYIRQAALGEPLIPYAERVHTAVQRLLASRPWTQPQRLWLDRIGQQMVRETLVDRDAIDNGQFRAAAGGFRRLDRVFDDRLEEVLGELHEEVWRVAG